MYICALSVRSLVECIYNDGDLVSTSSSMERAQLGSRIHRLLQAKAKEKGHYQSEVYVKHTTTIDDITFVVEGRVDGIQTDGDPITIEEIKTTACPYDQIHDHHFVHFAQAYCYGYFYMVEHDLAQVRIKLLYYQIETKQVKEFQQDKTRAQLHAFYLDLLHRYKRWADLAKDIQQTSVASLHTLTFPFTQYREGQHRFAGAVYKTIANKKVLFAQAPTGIGKTMATLFPALKAIGEKKIEKVFYLCAKNVTANVAYDTLRILYNTNAHFKSVGIRAKEKMCLQAEMNCDPQVCPYAKGYYQRRNDALYKTLTSYDFICADTITPIADAHQVCPFELLLDATLYADVIIGDYNYVFDPRVYLKRFFMEKGNYAFLVDEAHNLVARAREMYSASITKAEFKQLQNWIDKDRTSLRTTLQKIDKEWRTLAKQCKKDEDDFIAQSTPIQNLDPYLTAFVEQMDAYLQSDHPTTFDDALREVYFHALRYMQIHEYYDENYVTCLMKEEKELTLKQFCMNPANPLKNMMKKGMATVFFSATLSPIAYYQTLLGNSQTSTRLCLPSAFPKEHVHVMIANTISTRYHQRSKTADDIVAMIDACTSCKKGNYIVFAPSYTYMQQLSKKFHTTYPDIAITLQKANMDEQEKEQFLALFRETTCTHIFFCVIGGMFSEGIDLKGDCLIGAIIVSVGLPQMNPWEDLICAHFDRINHMGYSYAYQFPGMNKVIQSAGRVIRSDHDRGVLLFIDERYTQHRYRNLFPSHLLHYQIVHTTSQVIASTKQFWRSQDGLQK